MLKNLLIGVALLVSSSASSETVLGCYPKERVEKTLSNGEFVTLSRGAAPDGKITEIWLNGKGQMMIITYNKPKDKDSKSISEVCVITAIEDMVYNATTIEAMQKSFEKANPTQ